MEPAGGIGIYGKLPGYGDFLTRNLPSDFLQLWDEWLQLYVSVSKKQIGENWLEYYLTSPIWRFVLSSGAIDSQCWAGLIMPSVDRVGRYFPFSLVLPLSAEVSPVNFMLSQQQWFQDLESLSLLALDEMIDADGIIERTEVSGLIRDQPYMPTSHYGDSGAMVLELSVNNGNAVANSMSFMLDASLSTNFNSYSIWQTSGSNLITPSIFCSQGLPAAGNVSAMIDGQWQSRNWKIPFNMNV
jgi:type VI secretion system protein ImpM